jgi:hypothetical protein
MSSAHLAWLNKHYRLRPPLKGDDGMIERLPARGRRFVEEDLRMGVSSGALDTTRNATLHGFGVTEVDAVFLNVDAVVSLYDVVTARMLGL